MREIQQMWPAPPMNLWTQAFADMLLGKWVPWQDGEEGGWGTAIAAQVLDGGEQLLVTIEYDETTTNPPF